MRAAHKNRHHLPFFSVPLKKDPYLFVMHYHLFFVLVMLESSLSNNRSSFKLRATYTTRFFCYKRLGWISSRRRVERWSVPTGSSILIGINGVNLASIGDIIRSSYRGLQTCPIAPKFSTALVTMHSTYRAKVLGLPR